jgi:hypothetical protein
MKRRELYKFVEGSIVNTQTSGNVPVSYLSETYEPWSLKRAVVQVKNELTKASLEITLSLDNPIAQRHLSTTVDSVVSLTIFQQTDATTNVVWKGRMVKVKPEAKVVKLVFESIFTSLRRFGLRARYQKACRHTIYQGLPGMGCGVNKALHAYEDDVVSLSGSTLTMTDLSLYPDGRFAGGMIETLDDNVFRFVTAHVGNVLTLSRPYDHLAQLVAAADPALVAINVYPACKNNMDDCLDVFDNLDNYGGFPWIPSRNPMGGQSIV